MVCLGLKECQAKAWRSYHKNLCAQNEILLRLAALPRYPFVNYLTFKNDEKYSLPQYKFDPKYVQKTITPPVQPKEEKKLREKPTENNQCGLCKRYAQESLGVKGKPLVKTKCCIYKCADVVIE